MQCFKVRLQQPEKTGLATGPEPVFFKPPVQFFAHGPGDQLQFFQMRKKKKPMKTSCNRFFIGLFYYIFNVDTCCNRFFISLFYYIFNFDTCATYKNISKLYTYLEPKRHTQRVVHLHPLGCRSRAFYDPQQLK